MRTLADETAFVVGADVKDQSAAVDFNKLALGSDIHTERGGGVVADAELGADGAFALGKIGCDGVKRRFLHECDHAGGGENVKSAAAGCLCGVCIGDDGFRKTLYSEFHIDFSFKM